jgi:hypothetical protein
VKRIKQGLDVLQGQVVFTFVSTHHALKAEKVLQEAAVKSVIIPVPRRISSLCGLAIKMDPDLASLAQEVMQEAGVQIEEVHRF